MLILKKHANILKDVYVEEIDAGIDVTADKSVRLLRVMDDLACGQVDTGASIMERLFFWNLSKDTEN